MYQLMTTAAKKVGGPIALLGIVFSAGALATEGCHAITNKIGSVITKKNKAREAAVVHIVKKEGTSNEGLLFKVGEAFKVLEVDGNAAMIEKLGDNENPYFVSVQFLHSISDY